MLIRREAVGMHTGSSSLLVVGRWKGSGQLTHGIETRRRLFGHEEYMYRGVQSDIRQRQGTQTRSAGCDSNFTRRTQSGSTIAFERRRRDERESSVKTRARWVVETVVLFPLVYCDEEILEGVRFWRQYGKRLDG